MDKNPPIIAEKIHLQKIEVVQTRMDLGRFKESKKHALTLGHKLLHNLDENRIKLELLFSFKDVKEEEFLFMQIDFHFQIENLSDFYTLDDHEHPVFFGPAIGTLLAIAVSTSRGVIFEKLESNGISNIIIPVINPNKLLQESH